MNRVLPPRRISVNSEDSPLYGEDSPLYVDQQATDHVHILTTILARVSLSDFMRDFKANSSDWVHKEFPTRRDFAWQTSYGAFAISHSNLESVLEYIRNQDEHHRKLTFKEEFEAFLKRHEVAYDERYLWE